MLILTRKPGESLYIGDTVKVTIVEIKGNQIRVGIDAPRDLRIYREEIYVQIMEENKSAADVGGAELEGLLTWPAGPKVGPPSGGKGMQRLATPMQPAGSGTLGGSTSPGTGGTAVGSSASGAAGEGGTPNERDLFSKPSVSRLSGGTLRTGRATQSGPQVVTKKKKRRRADDEENDPHGGSDGTNDDESEG